MTKTEILETLLWTSWEMNERHTSRDALITLARKHDATVREIALVTGMSRQGIAKILKKSVDNQVAKA